MNLLLLLLAALLVGAAIVFAINRHGRRLRKHDAWLERLDIVLGNLHAERQRNYVQSLQRVTRKTAAPIPPGTIEVADSDLIIDKDKPP